MVQKINIEIEVESPNGLNDTELKYVKEAVERTIYEYDNFTGDILTEEYNLPEEVFVYCVDENDNADTTEETEETEE